MTAPQPEPPLPPGFTPEGAQKILMSWVEHPNPALLTAAARPLLGWLQWQYQRVSGDGSGPRNTEVLLTSAAEIEMEAATWLWELKIPMGELTIAAGREGAAKSQFTIWLTACVTRGTLPGELYGQPRDVIICAREDSWAKTIAPRLAVAGADMSRVHRAEVHNIYSGKTFSLSLPSDNEHLTAAIRSRNVALVVFDPLLSVLSGELNTHRASDVRAAIEPLSEIAHQTGCALAGLAHFAKTEGRDAASLISGSHAFKDVARSILVFARDELSSGVMSHVKSNLGPLPGNSWTYETRAELMAIGGRSVEVPRFILGEPTQRHVEDLLDTGRARASAVARDFLRVALSQGERLSKEIQEEAGENDIAPRTLKRARVDLGVIPRKDGQGQWYIRLPDPSNNGTVGSVGTHGIVGTHGPLPGQGVSVQEGQRGPTAPHVPARAHARGQYEQDDGSLNWAALWAMALPWIQAHGTM